MASPPIITQAHLDALRLIMASGKRSFSLQYADRSEATVYNGLDELLRLEAWMVSQLDAAPVEGTLARPRSWAVFSTKGF